jgi:putative acetyltransferase
VTVTVGYGDPLDPAASALLDASHALMHALFPSEANHYLKHDELKAPGIRFFVAEMDGRQVGCAALASRDGYGEVKSMFVDPSARGAGVAAALMARLEAEARAQGLAVMRLETGSQLDAAHRLYERFGFARRGPFGAYEDGPYNIFMEKRLEG